MKNKIIDRLNEKIESQNKRIDELKKYEPHLVNEKESVR